MLISSRFYRDLPAKGSSADRRSREEAANEDCEMDRL